MTSRSILRYLLPIAALLAICCSPRQILVVETVAAEEPGFTPLRGPEPATRAKISLPARRIEQVDSLELESWLPPGLNYPGFKKRVNLELQNAEIRDVLRLLADTGEFNLVVTEEVRGRVTMRLRNVTIREALGALCRARRLGIEASPRIMLVRPLGAAPDRAN